YRRPGQSITHGTHRLAARELNRSLHATDREERYRLGTKDLSSVREHLAWWTWGKNDTGSTIHRFECVAIDPPIMTLNTDGSVDLVHSIVDNEPGKAHAIAIDEIADDEFGRIVNHGHALALVEA